MKRGPTRHTRRLQVRFGTESPALLGFTEDISKGGLFIRAARVYAPGTALEMEIDLGDSYPIRLRGRVSWARNVPRALMYRVKGGMGVQIQAFDSGYERFLDLIAELDAAKP